MICPQITTWLCVTRALLVLYLLSTWLLWIQAVLLVDSKLFQTGKLTSGETSEEPVSYSPLHAAFCENSDYGWLKTM